MYSTILLCELPSSDILEITPERNQSIQCCLLSACARFLLNVNSTDYVDLKKYILVAS